MSTQMPNEGSYAQTRQRDAFGRFLRGTVPNPEGWRVNHHKLRAKLAELSAVYDPDGKLGPLDRDRLELAAKHLIIAHRARDPNTSVRSTNAAERLLALLPKPEPKPVPLDVQLGAWR